MVVGVLGASLALRNPDVVVLLRHHEVHVFGHALAGAKHLARLQRALHGKGLVDAGQGANPVELQQVVADGNLARGAEAGVYQAFIEERGVEHYVAVVAHESVALAYVHVVEVHVDAVALLGYELLQDDVAETALEVEVGLAGVHLLCHGFHWHVGVDVCYNLLELLVSK